jgi:hypothetical protein
MLLQESVKGYSSSPNIQVLTVSCFQQGARSQISGQPCTLQLCNLLLYRCCCCTPSTLWL